MRAYAGKGKSTETIAVWRIAFCIACAALFCPEVMIIHDGVFAVLQLV